MHAYENVREANQRIGEYIHFYNHERFHSSLQYRTPYQLYTGQGSIMKLCCDSQVNLNRWIFTPTNGVHLRLKERIFNGKEVFVSFLTHVSYYLFIQLVLYMLKNHQLFKLLTATDQELLLEDVNDFLQSSSSLYFTENKGQWPGRNSLYRRYGLWESSIYSRSYIINL